MSDMKDLALKVAPQMFPLMANYTPLIAGRGKAFDN